MDSLRRSTQRILAIAGAMTIGVATTVSLASPAAADADTASPALTVEADQSACLLDEDGDRQITWTVENTTDAVLNVDKVTAASGQADDPGSAVAGTATGLAAGDDIPAHTSRVVTTIVAGGHSWAFLTVDASDGQNVKTTGAGKTFLGSVDCPASTAHQACYALHLKFANPNGALIGSLPYRLHLAFEISEHGRLGDEMSNEAILEPGTSIETSPVYEFVAYKDNFPTEEEMEDANYLINAEFEPFTVKVTITALPLEGAGDAEAEADRSEGFSVVRTYSWADPCPPLLPTTGTSITGVATTAVGLVVGGAALIGVFLVLRRRRVTGQTAA